MPAPDLETLAARVDSHDESLRAISDTLVDLTSDVRGLGRRMDTLERRFDGLEQRFDGLQNTVDGLQNTVDGHTAILDQHSVTLDQHTGMLTEILRIVRAYPPDRLGQAAAEGGPPSP